ncbi:hypothetical protein DRO33_03480 [Candidatus Bathyarchaeota archaeon]|nr:MAG: hypothetical protein DRO33_03480 [Candidatus Bathyarchaeota archaeon]
MPFYRIFRGMPDAGELVELFADEPHFATENGVFVLGDARELIKRLPARSVDHVITDPPWGLGMDRYDRVSALYELEEDLVRVTGPDAWLVMYSQPQALPKAFRLRKFRYVWMLVRIFYRTYGQSPVGYVAHAPVLVFRKGNPRVHYKRVDVLVSDELPIIQTKLYDPQFKPTMTTATLLQMFTAPGDVVLDPFAGLGSIPLVCDLFGRRWVAFEINPRKFEVARDFIVERKFYPVNEDRKKEKGRARPAKTLAEWFPAPLRI